MRLRFRLHEFVEDLWPMFTGLQITFFHWTHNERVYLGFFGWRFWRWRALLTPYTLRKSFKLRQQP